jgi:hypothetical protein
VRLVGLALVHPTRGGYLDGAISRGHDPLDHEMHTESMPITTI